MNSVDEVTDLMRDQGLRVTPQRQCIMRLLVGNETHPTVEALYAAARVEMPTISLKTVYQTVHDLESLGEVRLLDVGTGCVRVDPNVERDHHHLVCSACGTIRDVSLHLPDLRVPARERRGFSVDEVDVIFRGRCESCGTPTSP